MLSNRVTTTQKERSLFRLLMIFAYSSTLGFSAYFYVREVHILAYNGFFCLSLFFIFGIASYFTRSLLWLFRFSVLTAFHAFYFEVFFTGGVLSPALPEFMIPPIIAFFYKPVRDRYFFMFLAIVCALSIWLLSSLGYTENRLPEACIMEMHIISTFFVFGIVAAYIYIYRKSLNEKNIALKKSYQKLIESEKMASLGLLSAGVAHEINNPLNFIKGGIEMLTMQLKDSNEAQTYIHAANEGVTRVTSIIDSLAHFSRDSLDMNEVCDLQKVIDNCLVMLNHRLKYKAQVIKQYEDLGSLRVIGNEGQLHQAFLNILTNAEESIDDSGTITINTYAERDTLKVSISDTGRGIAPENLHKINELFFTTKETGQGTGLGLSITYKVIEAHHGRVEVQSTLQEGTTFHITFNKPLTFESE